MKNVFLLLLLLFINPICVLNAQWEQTSGPETRTILCMALIGNNLFAGTEYDGVYLSTDNGSNWTSMYNGMPYNTVNAMAVNGNKLFAGTKTGGVFLTTNNGTNWTTVNNGLTSLSIKALVVNGPNIFAGTERGVFLSTNNGTNWTAVNNGLTSLSITAFVVNGSNIFAGTSNGIFTSADSGANWRAVNNGLFGPEAINTLAACGSKVIASDGISTYFSTNNGEVWESLNNDLLSSGYITALAVKGENIFAGIYARGVFLSTDNGVNWREINDSNLYHEARFIRSLIAGSNYLFIGVTKMGVWRRSLEGVMLPVEDDKSNLPNEYSLMQNYPNPFNPSTSINYKIIKPGMVYLRVFDLLGREVAVLVNEEKNAGSFNVSFNASHLTSGIYYYQLRTNDYLETKKMVLIK